MKIISKLCFYQYVLLLTLILPLNKGLAQTESCDFPEQVQKAISLIDNKEGNRYTEAHEALYHYIKAKPKNQDSCQAIIYHRLGLSSYDYKSLEEEIGFYKKALTHSLKQKKPFDPFNVKLHVNIANRYSEMEGSFFTDSFPSYIKKAFDLEQEREKRGLPFSTVYPRVSRILADYYDYLGDYDNAKICFEIAARYYQKDASNILKLAAVYNDLTWLYSERLKDPTPAIEYAEKALEIPGISLYDKINLHFNLGLALEIKGTQVKAEAATSFFDKAIKHYENALALCHREGDMAEMISNLQNNIGVLLNEKKAFGQALDSLEKARIFNDEQGIVENLAYNYDNIGESYRGLGTLEKALSAFTKSIEYSFAGFKPENDLQTPELYKQPSYDKVGVLSTLASKAELLILLYEKNGDIKFLESAYEHYDFIDAFIHSIRNTFFAQASKYSLASSTKPIFEKAIRTCLLMAENTKGDHYRERAFYFAERSKALSLLEFINDQSAARIVLDHEVKDSLFELMQKRDFHETELAYAIAYNDSAYVDVCRDNVIAYRSAFENMQTRLKKTYPEYDVLLAERSNFSPDRIRKKVLNKGQAIVEYFLGDDHNYAFIITKNMIDAISIKSDISIRDEVEKALLGLRGYYEDNPDKKEQSFFKNTLIQSSNALYKILIEPLGTLPERLIIIPDEYLLYLPFEILLKENIDPETGFQQFPYLVREKKISYNFSIALLEEMLQKKHDHDPSVFWGAFAPVFPRDSFPGEALGSLSYSARSASQTVAECGNGGELFELGDANHKNFLDNAEKYKVLQLPTHCIVNDLDSSLVELVLWDSSLYLNDLYTLNLNAELVILNACNTNVGQLHRGEGIASLNRGFVSAGASSVLTTIWQAKDAYTPQFMPPFKKALMKGKAKDLALHAAKLDNLKNDQYSDPYYWSNYLLYGDTARVKRPFIYNILIILTPLLIMALFFFFRNKNIKRKSLHF